MVEEVDLVGLANRYFLNRDGLLGCDGALRDAGEECDMNE